MFQQLLILTLPGRGDGNVASVSDVGVEGYSPEGGAVPCISGPCGVQAVEKGIDIVFVVHHIRAVRLADLAEIGEA